MQLPFTVEQFFGAFRAYNAAVWPVQLLLHLLAVAALAMVAFPRRWSGAGVSQDPGLLVAGVTGAFLLVRCKGRAPAG